MSRLARDLGDENPPVCGHIPITRSSIVQPAGRRRACSRRRPPVPVRGGSGQPVRGPARPTGASGDRLGRRPAGGVSRTATQSQRRQARMAVSSRGLLARYHVGPGSRPGQPAGVSHPTVAQVRTDLQGISLAERNWSDEGWRLAVAAGVPGRLGTWPVSHPPAPEPGLGNGPVRPRVRARGPWRRLYRKRPACTC